MVNLRLPRLASVISVVGLPQLERDRLFQQHVLAGLEAIARDRIMRWTRAWSRCETTDDRSVLDDVAVVERRGCRVGQLLDLGQAVGPDLTDVQLVDERGARQRFRPYAPHQPVPITATSTCCTRVSCFAISNSGDRRRGGCSIRTQAALLDHLGPLGGFGVHIGLEVLRRLADRRRSRRRLRMRA